MSDENRTPDRPTLYHYKLNRILGQGGTGMVYRGIDQKKGEVVAIKRFHENFFRNQMHIRDLKRTLKKVYKYDHKNVVGIFDFLDTDPTDGYCMIMEYVDGPNLMWYLRNHKYNQPERISIASQLCSGLQYLHDKGTIHHDFKPANVLFTRRGVVKITDYSLYGGNWLLELLDRGIGEQITPMYVAPEFIRKDKVTPAADQYALGITMYMMFTDRLPYVVDSLQKLYQCHLQFTPDHPSDVNPICPRDIGDVIMKLLAKRADDRFTDCDEVAIALSRVGRSRI